MIVAPVHTRKKGGAFGTKKEAAVRFALSVPFWCIAAFLLLFIFKLPNKNAVLLVLIDIIVWIPFCRWLTFYFLTVRNGGELLLEDYIRFKNGVIGNNHSFFYSDVKYIYIGTCPLPLTMWS